MDNGFDFGELDKFREKIIKVAQDDFPKETKKFMRKEGTSLRKLTLKKAKKKFKKKTGNLFKAIKRGKVYIYKGNGGTAVRVYSGARHTHLLEYGHRKVSHDGKELGFVEGGHFFEEAYKEYEDTFAGNTESFIDEVVDEIIK